MRKISDRQGAVRLRQIEHPEEGQVRGHRGRSDRLESGSGRQHAGQTNMLGEGCPQAGWLLAGVPTGEIIADLTTAGDRAVVVAEQRVGQQHDTQEQGQLDFGGSPAGHGISCASHDAMITL